MKEVEFLALNRPKEDKQPLLHLHYLWNEVLMYSVAGVAAKKVNDPVPLALKILLFYNNSCKT